MKIEKTRNINYIFSYFFCIFLQQNCIFYIALIFQYLAGLFKGYSSLSTHGQDEMHQATTETSLS